MSENGRQLRVLVSIAIVCCALVIGFNLFFVKEPAETVILTDAGLPAGEQAEEEKININTADAETLTKLEGIGDVLAARIIAYREENGGFSAIEEIQNVSGIGEVIFAKIEAQIEVG